ncbi:hypothetical protein S40288_02517 [Stachybotrys chartarum IBT 40288]|nr:hypothetical protein S40288_02517 [Stachybotrys chartarum IBT 40288]
MGDRRIQQLPSTKIQHSTAQHSTAQQSTMCARPPSRDERIVDDIQRSDTVTGCCRIVARLERATGSCSAPSPPRHVGPSVIANQPSSPGNQNPAPRVANITLHQCISSRTCPGMPVPHAKGDHGGPVPVDGHSSPGQNNNATAQSSGVACRRMAPKS